MTDFYLPPKQNWPPVDIFGPEQFQKCSQGHGRMRYCGINYWEDEPEKGDLHMWICQKCGEMEEVPATLTEQGKEKFKEFAEPYKPPPDYMVDVNHEP